MTPPASAAVTQPARRLPAPRTRPLPGRPRRVSGPARPAARPAAGGASSEGLLAGLLGVAETVSGHRLLDRLIRSRLWIGLIAFALIGIVTLQLGLLQLNSGIGRALEREAALQRQNAALAIENSELASGTRVEAEAERLGLRLTGVSSLHFLSSHARSDGSRAVALLRKPLAPAGEPPGATEPGTETTAEASESAAGGSSATAGTETGGESSSGATGPTREATTQPSGATATTPETSESTGTAATGESGATAAPGSSAAGSTPVGTTTGGGTAAPGG